MRQINKSRTKELKKNKKTHFEEYNIIYRYERLGIPLELECIQ